MTNKREYAFDALRVIAMIMVVVIHVANVYTRSFSSISSSSYVVSLIFSTFSRVSVPIFFMISGALLLDRKFDTKKYLKRIKKFIILIIVWDLVYLIWEYLFLGVTHDNLLKLIKEPYRAHLWFLYTILLIYILQPLLRIVLNKLNKPIKYIILIAWLSLSIIGVMGIIKLPGVFSTLTHIGYFIMGKYLYDFSKSKDLRKFTIFFIIVIIVCVGLSVYLNYTTSLARNHFYKGYLGYRTPFLIFSSFAFYLMVLANFKKDSLSNKVMILSEVSLGVYLIHGIFLDITKVLFDYGSVNSIIGIPILSTIIFIFSVASVYYLKKIKLLKDLL